MSDDFLQFLKETRRGRFKVYLGMAAGVGKTVAMLREGKRVAGEGVSVVCAVVETHGRKETLAELAGIEVLPRRTIEYRGVPLEEMDLDAVFARKADLVLVDELAHTNVPGSRHDKRWQDVEALLDAGTSVIGTLNVQHLESLHDLVLRETEVDVRERVPDRFLHRADEIVVIDLPPEDLQERLRQGKITPRRRWSARCAASSAPTTWGPCGSSPCARSPTPSSCAPAPASRPPAAARTGRAPRPRIAASPTRSG